MFLFVVCLLFQEGFLSVALVALELTLETKLASASYLLELNGLFHHHLAKHVIDCLHII